MESEVSCRSTAISEDEVERCDVGSDRDDDTCCSCVHCPPYIFTSILLGLLACVLVSGGVFLAFHKWDHTWLLVSAVGVVLMIIGTALHCCSTSKNDRKNHRCKGSCNHGGRNSKPDALGNGGLLTEQLLPLSNARSVSQLSLNMVPGYFPPLVYPSASTPYGLEQHSAVVQNISRLVQHQQQLHLQAPSTTGDGARSFILLSLPADANAANIQNLVNAVCQLDSSNQPENAASPDVDDPNVPSPPVDTNNASATSASSPPTPESSINACATVTATAAPATPPASSSSSSSQPMLKHAEVQTCSNWPNPVTPELKTNNASNCNSASEGAIALAVGECSSTIDTVCQVGTDGDLQRTEARACLIEIECPLQTHESATVVNSADLICDTEGLPTQVDIPPLIPSTGQSVGDSVLLNDSASVPAIEPVVEPASSAGTVHSIVNSSSTAAVANSDPISPSPDSGESSADNSELTNGTGSSTQQVISATSDMPTSEDTEQNLNIEEPSDGSSDFEEESELLDRSSPPPSYEDVTQEVQSPVPGAVGLAYGTM